MTAKNILEEIAPLGRESYKRVLMKHGVKEPCYGVKISDLKIIQKRIKKNYLLAKELFDTGIYDAMYLAGLISDDSMMTPSDLQHWVKTGYGPLLSSTVPWVASESKHGWAMGLKWIDSSQEGEAGAGWVTLGCVLSMKPDEELDLSEISKLLKRVETKIASAPNEVRYQMNGFIIAAGCHIKALSETAKIIAKRIGQVKVDMGETDCKVPYAPDYIQKVENKGGIGKKRKSVKC